MFGLLSERFMHSFELRSWIKAQSVNVVFADYETNNKTKDVQTENIETIDNIENVTDERINSLFYVVWSIYVCKRTMKHREELVNW